MLLYNYWTRNEQNMNRKWPNCVEENLLLSRLNWTITNFDLVKSFNIDNKLLHLEASIVSKRDKKLIKLFHFVFLVCLLCGILARKLQLWGNGKKCMLNSLGDIQYINWLNILCCLPIGSWKYVFIINHINQYQVLKACLFIMDKVS